MRGWVALASLLLLALAAVGFVALVVRVLAGGGQAFDGLSLLTLLSAAAGGVLLAVVQAVRS